MIRPLRAILIASLSAALAPPLLAACGGDGDSSPPAQCRELESTYCNTVVNCFIRENLLLESGRRMETDECVTALDLGCGDAIDVGDSFDDCLRDIRAESCDVIVDETQSETGFTPATCSQVILFPEESLD